MSLGRTNLLLLLALCYGTVLKATDGSAELQSGQQKRYIAALAKNGRLPPKPSHRSEEKREEEGVDSWLADHEGQQQQAVVLPSGEEGAEDPDLFYFNDEGLRSQEPEKRYLGALLKSRGKPRGVQETESGESEGEEVAEERAASPDKRFVGAFFNSRGKPVVVGDQELSEDNSNDPSKRNIASLARKGWLSAIRSYRSPVGSRIPVPRRYSSYNDKRDDSLYSDEPRVITSEDLADCLEEPAVDLTSDGGDVLRSVLQKRNIAFLARNGMLPPRRGGGAVTGGSFGSDPFSLKRNRPALLPRPSQLRWAMPVPKRLRSGQLKIIKVKARCSPDAKRNVAAMARKGLLPTADKKSVASMARKGLLPGAGGQLK